MIAIFIAGKSEPLLAARVSCSKKHGLQFEGENGKLLKVIATTIKNVVINYDANALLNNQN